MQQGVATGREEGCCEYFMLGSQQGGLSTKDDPTAQKNRLTDSPSEPDLEAVRHEAQADQSSARKLVQSHDGGCSCTAVPSGC
jgi:hypothetical protein